MKTSPYLLLVVNAFLAIGLTVLSLQYVQPKNCYSFCDPSYIIPCPKGSCYFGDQKAGWPLPIIIDSGGGGSPTTGWGVLGNEDLPDPILMIADVLFYSILIWIILYAIQFLRHRAFSHKLFLVSLPISVFLGAALWFFYLIYIPTLGFQVIGRGQRGSVDVQVSTDIDIHTAMTFTPRLSIPLDEVIEYYGDPDYVVFTSDGTTQGRATGSLLYWDAVPVFVALPQIADSTYPVYERTEIDRIIFYDDLDVIAIAGRPISEEKTGWTGYGNYQP